MFRSIIVLFFICSCVSALRILPSSSLSLQNNLSSRKGFNWRLNTIKPKNNNNEEQEEKKGIIMLSDPSVMYPPTQLNAFELCLCGAFATAFGDFCVHPIDTIKITQQAAGKE